MEPLAKGDPGRVGGYTLEGRLGGGGMGQVYLGRSRGGRAVAVKVVRQEYVEDAGFRDRFRREVELASRVGGFWTANILDADPDAPSPWVASEYIEGPTLAQRVKREGPLPVDEVRRLAAGLAEALDAIHTAGLIHRDLKPGNIILTDDGPRVIDFGISKALDGLTGLTATGAVIGTPGYMSPEQALGAPMTFAGDVFSLGSVLAYAATGRQPFGTGAAHALLYRVVHGEPELTGLSEELLPLLTACLRKDPERRPTATEVLGSLGTSPTVRPPAARVRPAVDLAPTVRDTATVPLPSTGRRPGTPPAAGDGTAAAEPFAFDNDGTQGEFLRGFLMLPVTLVLPAYCLAAVYLDLDESESLLEEFSPLGAALAAVVAVLLYALVASNLRRHTDCALRIDEKGVLLRDRHRETRLAWADIAAVRTDARWANRTPSGRFLRVTVTPRGAPGVGDVRFSFSCPTGSDYRYRLGGMKIALSEFAPEEVDHG